MHGYIGQYGKLTAATVPAIANTFRNWLKSASVEEYNPRRATLSVWAEVNFTDVDETLLDKVWEKTFEKPLI